MAFVFTSPFPLKVDPLTLKSPFTICINTRVSAESKSGGFGAACVLREGLRVKTTTEKQHYLGRDTIVHISKIVSDGFYHFNVKSHLGDGSTHLDRRLFVVELLKFEPVKRTYEMAGGGSGDHPPGRPSRTIFCPPFINYPTARDHSTSDRSQRIKACRKTLIRFVSE